MKEKKRKILFHINSLGKGGAERVVTVLSGYFAEDGYQVLIVTLWRAEEEFPLPAKVKRINLGDLPVRAGGRFVLALQRFLSFRKSIKTFAPDIVISFCNKANFRSAFAMAGMKTPLLTSVRNDPEKDYRPYKAACWWMEKKASGCVFQTRQAKEFFSKNFQKKSRIIWNPVDEKYLAARQKRQSVRKEERQRNNHIVSVGRISKQKNHLLLLKAFSRIMDRFPAAKVQIYGEDCEMQVRVALDQYTEQKKMKEKVEFMGQCDNLEDVIGDAALFVMPSDYEGMPNALAEAMTLGLPVIATDCPCKGPAALIEDGVSGLLVPVGDENALADAMEKLLSNRELAENMGQEAMQVAEKISPFKVYGQWKQYVEDLMA